MNFYEQIAAWSVWSQVFCPRCIPVPDPHRPEGTPERLHRRRGRGQCLHQLRSGRRLEPAFPVRPPYEVHPAERRRWRAFWSAFTTGEIAYA